MSVDSLPTLSLSLYPPPPALLLLLLLPLLLRFPSAIAIIPCRRNLKTHHLLALAEIFTIISERKSFRVRCDRGRPFQACEIFTNHRRLLFQGLFLPPQEQPHLICSLPVCPPLLLLPLLAQNSCKVEPSRQKYLRYLCPPLKFNVRLRRSKTLLALCTILERSESPPFYPSPWLQ